MLISFIFNLILALYPLDRTYAMIKKPRLALCLHWCIWWFLYSGFILGESVCLNYLPFWDMIKLLVLIPNYSPRVSSWTLDIIKVWSKRIKAHPYGKEALKYWGRGKEYLTGWRNQLYESALNRQLGPAAVGSENIKEI